MKTNQLGRLGVCDTPPIICHGPSWPNCCEVIPMPVPKPYAQVTEADILEVYNHMPAIHTVMSWEQAKSDPSMAILMRRQAALGCLTQTAPEPLPARKMPVPTWGRCYLFEPGVKKIYTALRSAYAALTSGTCEPDNADVRQQLERAIEHLAKHTKPAKRHK